jgi:hypothetical protein
MRGDSVRDRYAKGLALLGMGLLGIAGVLVDHWPVAVHLPHVASIAPRPSAAGPLRLASVSASSQGRESAGAPGARLRRLLPAKHTDPAVALSEPATQDVPAALVTAVPVVRSVPVAAASVALSAPSQHPVLRTAAPIALDVSDLEALAPVAFAAPVAADEDGMITGALKKTGASLVRAGGSIVRTGVKTGSVIGGALRGVGGAIVKVF